MADKVKVVLKNKYGKVTRELNYPLTNAEKLINFKSGWVLSDNSGYKLTKGVLEKAKEITTKKIASPE